MILLVSGATSTVKKYKEHKNLGQFKTPDTRNSIKKIIENGLPWACDNGCYKKFDIAAFFKMVYNIKDKPGLLFVAMPDKVCDAVETKKLFNIWFPIMKKYFNTLPLAYVLQNGVTEDQVPWDKISAVFIGGDNKFKEDSKTAQIVKIAKTKGKWVHMGRVNTPKRINLAFQIDCDSIDGSGFSKFPETYIPDALKLLNILEFLKILKYLKDK